LYKKKLVVVVVVAAAAAAVAAMYRCCWEKIHTLALRPYMPATKQ
jgi:hypothetical protein